MSSQQQTSLPQQEAPAPLTEAQRTEIKTLIQNDLPGLDIPTPYRSNIFRRQRLGRSSKNLRTAHEARGKQYLRSHGIRKNLPSLLHRPRHGQETQRRLYRYNR